MDYFMRRIVHVFHIEMIEHVLTANKPTPSHYRTRLLPAQDNKVLANLRAYLSKGVNDLPEEYTNDMKKSDMTEVEFSIVLSSAVKLREVQSSFDQACASFENYQRSMSPGARRGGSTPSRRCGDARPSVRGCALTTWSIRRPTPSRRSRTASSRRLT